MGSLNVMAISLHQTFRSHFVRSLKTSKLFPHSSSIQGCRTLYSNYNLGIQGFLYQGERLRDETTYWKVNFLNKMKDLANGSKEINNIYSEDLRRFLAFCQEDEKHIDTFIILMKRFYKQVNEINLNFFKFGPCLLRIFHIHQLADRALEVLLDPELEEYVSYDICYQLAMDLLYEKGRYEDVLKLMKKLNSSPKSCITLASAANYKISTEEALENSINLYQTLYNAGRRPTFKMIGFTSGLALKLGKPEIALEMCSNSSSFNHFLIFNLRILAKTRLGELSEVVHMLEKNILTDLPTKPSSIKSLLASDVIEEIEKEVEDSLEPDLNSKFSHLKNTLHHLNLISSTDLDHSICAPIMDTVANERQPNSTMRGSSDRNQSRYWQNRNRSNWQGDNRTSSQSQYSSGNQRSSQFQYSGDNRSSSQSQYSSDN